MRTLSRNAIKTVAKAVEATIKEHSTADDDNNETTADISEWSYPTDLLKIMLKLPRE